MKRRDFITFLAGATYGWPLVVASAPSTAAEQEQRLYRVGFLRVGEPPRSFIEPLRQGLKDLGYVEGQNLIIDFGVGATAEQLPEAASALVSRGVDLIFASGAAAVFPAKNAAKAIPVVFVAGIDPIANGLTVKGLAQPGGNVT
jgi:putative ABC transport system substrate-binding protein